MTAKWQARIYVAPGWFLVVRLTLIVLSLGRGRVLMVYPFGEKRCAH